MAPFASVRTRWHALQVFLRQARIDAELESPAPSLTERELGRLVRRQDRELRELLETARALPSSSGLRRAAERAFDTGQTCLVADPDSETFVLASHEHELALRELRRAILRAGN